MRYSVILLSFLPCFVYAGGRFELMQLGNSAKDQFLLDTQTGKIWQRTCMYMQGLDCKVEAWEPEPIIGITTTYNQVDRTIKAVKSVESKQ